MHCDLDMPLRTGSLTIAIRGDAQDAPPDAPQRAFADGVHLHWKFARTPGFPRYGYHLFRREHRAGTPRRLSEYVGVLTPGQSSGRSLDTSLGSVISDRPLLLTNDFPACDAVALDLHDRAWLRFVLPQGTSARRMECRIGFRPHADCPPKVCIDFTGRAPGSGSNPRREEDPITHEAVMFLAHHQNGAPRPNTHAQSIQLGGARYTGLSCEGGLKITLPSASSYVEAAVSSSVSPVLLEAYNEDGSLAGRVTSADPKGKAGHGPELLRIDGHTITRVVVQDYHGKGLLHRLCCQPIPVTTIRVTALAGRTPVFHALACGRPGQIVVVAVEFDGMDAIELAPGPAALLDVGVVAFKDELTVGWTPAPGFPAPMCLPLTHPGCPCMPGEPENLEQTPTLEPQGTAHDQRMHLVTGSALPPAIPRQRPLDLVISALNPAFAQTLSIDWVDRTAQPGVAYDYLLVADHGGRGQLDSTMVLVLIAQSSFEGLEAFLIYHRSASPPLASAVPTAGQPFGLPDMSGGDRAIGRRWDPNRPDEGLPVPGGAGMRHLWRADFGASALTVPHAISQYRALDSTSTEVPVEQAVPLPQAFEQPSIKREDEPSPATLRRLRQIQVYIDTHLADPGLSPKRIAAANRISLRYLYKLFLHANCAVNQWIRERRLTRCAEALVSPAQANRNIAEIAYAWGFNDLSHFNRMFKRRFGVSPRGYQRIADAERASP
jgi:AraC-like DNA-binding protein